jgi:hypothetical protein
MQRRQRTIRYRPRNDQRRNRLLHPALTDGTAVNLGSDGNPRLQPSPQALLAGSGLPGGLRAVPGGKGRRVTAARPLRDLEPEGGGFAAAHLTKWAAAPGPGDAPREGTGPPLSVKAGCDRGTTANRPAAWHRYTRNPALSTEPPAAPEGSKGGQARPAPTPERGASGDHQAPRTSERQKRSELAFDCQEERENYTNPLTASVHGSGGLPGCAVPA